MKIWQHIKHAFGFHGADNEWLDGRIFIDHAERTYHCKTCGDIYVEYHLIPNGEHDYELNRLRTKRDRERKEFRAYFDQLKETK